MGVNERRIAKPTPTIPRMPSMAVACGFFRIVSIATVLNERESGSHC
jgi:hypothetical protein